MSAVPLLLVLGAVVLWAVVLARLPVDRAPEPSAARVEYIAQYGIVYTDYQQHVDRFWINFYRDWADELARAANVDLDRWADDGGPA